MNDPVDRNGAPPPNEDLTSFYLIIKNLRPATARLDALEAITVRRGDLVGMEERQISGMSSNIYVSFGSVSAVSVVLHHLPPYIRGRQVWFGHAASKYVWVHGQCFIRNLDRNLASSIDLIFTFL